MSYRPQIEIECACGDQIQIDVPEKATPSEIGDAIEALEMLAMEIEGEES